jgi:hypothetical protein
MAESLRNDFENSLGLSHNFRPNAVTWKQNNRRMHQKNSTAEAAAKISFRLFITVF